jgi:hypothetical protein
LKSATCFSIPLIQDQQVKFTGPPEGVLPPELGLVVPVLRLFIHPEMERPAIVNKSMPSTEGSTMSNPTDLMARPSSTFQRKVSLSMRNTIYLFREKYT